MEINEELNTRYTVKQTALPAKPGCWNKQLIEVFDSGSKIGEYEYDYHDGAPFHAFEQNGKHYALYSRHYQETRVMRLPDCVDLCGESKPGFCPVNYVVPVLYGQWAPESDPSPMPPNWDSKRWAIEVQKTDSKGMAYTRLYWPTDKEDKAPKSLLPAYLEAKAKYDIDIKAWDERHPWEHRQASFGFVCGCYWGDDSSWKIQYLDLSRIEEGILTNEPRFGYVEMLGGRETLKDCIEIDSDSEYVRISCIKHFRLSGEEL